MEQPLLPQLEVPLAERIRALRRHMGLSTEQFGAACFSSPPEFGELETGSTDAAWNDPGRA